MAIFDPIFAPKIADGGRFFDFKNEDEGELFGFPAPKSEDGGFFHLRSSTIEDPHFRRTPHLRRTPLIFEEPPPYLRRIPPSLIFGPEDRRPPLNYYFRLRRMIRRSDNLLKSSIFDLRSRKSSTSLLYHFRLRKMTRRSDRRREMPLLRNYDEGIPSKKKSNYSIFRLRRTNNPLSSSIFVEAGVCS